MSKFSLLIVIASALSAQVRTPPPRPAPEAAQANQAPQANDDQPIFRVTVVERTTNAVSYRHRSGWTKVDLHGTPLAPDATGHADVNSRPGYIEAKADMHKLLPASQYGPEYMTYVLWAITPEGRAKNLGEVVLNDGSSHLDVTTDLQAFALIVTAEPYFGVTQPSDVVVMENIIREDTVGKIEQMSVKYDLLKRGAYTMQGQPGRYHQVKTDKKIPLQLLEAENAVQIAQLVNADQYAKDTYDNAQQLVKQAEAYQARNAGSKPVIMTSREAVQAAETSRLLALKRQDDERIAREKKEAADREAAARAQADEQSRQRQLADAQAAESARQKALADAQARASAERASAERANADLARAQAEAERLRAERERAAAEEQQRQADQARLQAQQSQQQAQAADQARLQAEEQQRQLRQQLLQQFNMILETRDTARGLIVNMSDVLFDFNKYTLRPAAREKLAKISGIILSHPGLRLEVDGYTDSIGSESYNQKLSEQRADQVRTYLISESLPSDIIVSKGFGKENPVASNDNSAGRQKNRRVEMVVSGEIIGQSIGGIRSSR
ncbi:MAG TPA: OmpA family protein [Bryobacteraceae bacterium]|nr:OmpA family protein [Bryobacteraceae bacterium]